MFLLSALWLLPLVAASPAPLSHNRPNHNIVSHNRPNVAIAQAPTKTVPTKASNCFPGLGFNMPASPPKSLDGWWCDYSSEYAFVGISYEVTQCQSLNQLKREFKDVRDKFHGRYIRLYGACDREGFYNDIIEAAWYANVGVHALIWFGFDGSDIWKTRRDTLFGILHSNPRAPYVIRVVQFGSEPLYDYVLEPEDLAEEVRKAQSNLANLRIPVTISEMAYGYQARMPGAQEILDAVDIIDAHMLPFFSQSASTADQSWPIVQTDLNWFIQNGQGKKIYFSQNGWPSTTYPGVEPNSPSAVADVPNEARYFEVLDDHCEDFKNVPGGGVGWFAHIYSDSQEPGYGIYDKNGAMKFDFRPRTEC